MLDDAPGEVAIYDRRMRSRGEALIRVLKFGKRRVKRMVREKDAEGMEVAFRALGELKGLQMLEEED